MTVKVKAKSVRIDVNSSNSERVRQVEEVINRRLHKGAEDTPAFRKIIMKEVGAFSKGEFLKAKEVVDSGGPEKILIMNKRGLTAGYNQVKPKVRKKIEKRYNLSAKSSDIMRFVAHRYYSGQGVGAVIERMFNEWAKDYVTEYKNYADEERQRIFNYKNNGAGEENC